MSMTIRTAIPVEYQAVLIVEGLICVYKLHLDIHVHVEQAIMGKHFLVDRVYK